MTRSTETTQSDVYGPDPLDPDAMQALMRQRRQDRDAPPAWWVSAKREPRSFHHPEAFDDVG